MVRISIISFLFLISTVSLFAEGTIGADSIQFSSNSVTEPAKYISIDSSLKTSHDLGAFDMITNLPDDWWSWGKQTFTLEQLPVIVGLSAITAATVVTDYETWQPFKKWYESNYHVRDVNDFFSYLGDGKVQFGIAAAYAVYGFGFHDKRALRTASQTVEVILACGAVVQFLKHTTGRESPFVATTPTGRWVLFPNQIEYATHVPHYDAFPSGHVATALATLTVIAENYPEQTWIPYVGYPIITGIAVGLVATSIHWWSDIPLGVAMGYSFGKLVAHPEVSETLSGQNVVPTIFFTSLGDGTPTLNFFWQL